MAKPNFCHSSNVVCDGSASWFPSLLSSSPLSARVSQMICAHLRIPNFHLHWAHLLLLFSQTSFLGLFRAIAFRSAFPLLFDFEFFRPPCPRCCSFSSVLGSEYPPLLYLGKFFRFVRRATVLFYKNGDAAGRNIPWRHRPSIQFAMFFPPLSNSFFRKRESRTVFAPQSRSGTRREAPFPLPSPDGKTVRFSNTPGGLGVQNPNKNTDGKRSFSFKHQNLAFGALRSCLLTQSGHTPCISKQCKLHVLLKSVTHLPAANCKSLLVPPPSPNQI